MHALWRRTALCAALFLLASVVACDWDSNGRERSFTPGTGGNTGGPAGGGSGGSGGSVGGSNIVQTPELTWPAVGAAALATDVRLVWQGWPGLGPQVSFDLQVSTADDFSQLVVDRQGLDGLSFELTSLNPGTTYYWQVRAANGQSTSAWSLPGSFTTWRAAPRRPVIYQLVVRHFGNTQGANQTDGDIATNGVGKFADIDERAISRLAAMGITHVWLTGVLQQATATDYSAWGEPADDPDILKGQAGSFYAVRDYFDVCPDYAVDPGNRLQEFQDLVARLHAAGLKVMIDFVPNHVARSYHSDVRPNLDFGLNDDQSTFFDPQNNFFYLAQGQALVMPSTSWQHPGMNGSFTRENGQPGQTARVTGNNAATLTPSQFDWYETVKLNYGYDFTTGATAYSPTPSTWTIMDEVLAYWQGLGVDGFRCDFAHYVPLEFWEWAIARAKGRADCFFLAEAYEGTGDAVPGFSLQALVDKGFDAVYDDATYDTLKRMYQGSADKAALDSALFQINDTMRPRFLRYLENHDERRLASPIDAGGSPDDSGFGGTAAGYHLAPIVYLVGSGPLLVYNGQTVGETGAGIEGFGGDDGKTSIFDYWRLPALSDWVNGGLFDGGGLSQAQRELHEYYRRLLNLAQHPLVLSERYYGLDFANSGDPDYPAGLYAFARYDDAGGRLMVVVVSWSLQAETGRIKLPQDLAENLAVLPGECRVVRIHDETATGDAVEVANLLRSELISDGFPVSVPNQAARVYVIEER